MFEYLTGNLRTGSHPKKTMRSWVAEASRMCGAADPMAFMTSQMSSTMCSGICIAVA